jgi:hypothetical protein
MLRKMIFVVMICLLAMGTAFAEPISGHYVRVPSKKNVDTAEINVTKISDKEIQVNLEVMANTPNDGFVRVPRYGVLENEKLEIQGNIAIYYEPSSSSTPCIIVFVFNRSTLEVAQFGTCDSFGYEVYATGKYLLRSESKKK